MLASPCRLRALLATPARLAQLEPPAGPGAIYRAPPALLNRVVGFELHRGAVASFDRPPEPLAAGLIERAARLAVLEGINDVENLGAIFRSAAALGVEGILLDPTCADPFYRRCVRVSMGEVAHVPFARVGSWPEGLDALPVSGFTLVGLTPSGAVAIDEVSVDGRVAMMLGAEGPGLSEGALSRCEVSVRIPMRPGPDSLNVGHAAAIAFHRLFARP